MTVGELLHTCRRQLQDTSPTPALDAQVLLMHCLTITRAALIAREHDHITESEQQHTLAMLEQRCQGVPIAHLTGTREFWSLEFAVSKDVLIPRPDTEVLVEHALAHLKAGDRVVDLGTGSGAIAIAIAHERSDIHVVATDISEGALQQARLNARRLQVGNISFCSGQWFAAVANQTFDMIVSNPPYIASDDSHLQEGDVRYEPEQALIAQRSGLADLYTIIDGAQEYLNVTGKVLVEHGYQQGRAVRERLNARGFSEVATVNDYSGNERVSIGAKPVDA